MFYLKFITEFLLDCSSFVVNILPANINKKCCEQQLFMACKVTRGREREREIQEKKNNLISFNFIHFWYFKTFSKLSPFYTLHCLHILAWMLKNSKVKVWMIWLRRSEIVSLCYIAGSLSSNLQDWHLTECEAIYCDPDYCSLIHLTHS